MKIFLTGATGFIGRYVLGALNQTGHEIHAVHHGEPPSPPGAARWLHLDLHDHESVRKTLFQVRPEALLHMAWYPAHGDYCTSKENLSWVASSLNLFKAFADAGGSRAVFAGTCFEYDLSGGTCSESATPIDPKTYYGKCKDSLRRILLASAPEFGVKLAWARIFYVFGKGEHPSRLVPSITQALLRNQDARCTAGTQRRDYLYAGDLANAFASLLLSPVEGAINMASGEAIAVSEIASSIAKQLNRTDRLKLGVLPLSPTEPPLILGTADRLKNEVGWKPHYTLDRGLAETITWWSQQTSLFQGSP